MMVSAPALRRMPVHHRQAITENAHPGERAAIENRRAPLALEEREPEQHHGARHQPERVRDEFRREPIGRVRYDAADPRRRVELFEEIDAGFSVGAAVIEQVGRVNAVTGRPQDLRDRTGAAGRFPHIKRQTLDTEQRAHGLGRCLVQIDPAVGVPVRAGVGGMRDHGSRLPAQPRCSSVRNATQAASGINVARIAR
jgi:hypothetical protein